MNSCPVPPPLLAALLTVGPLLLGFAAGRIWRRGRFAAHLIAALAVVATCEFVGFRLRIGVWDSGLVGSLLALGGLAGAHASPLQLRRALLAIAAGTIALIVTDSAIGHWHPRPLFFSMDDQCRLTLPRPHRPGEHVERENVHDSTCAMIYADESSELFRDRAGSIHKSAPAILHVGDSMVVGWGVAPELTFTALMHKADPRVEQVNASHINTTIDYDYLVAKHWTELRPFDLVVIYPFAGSDIVDMDQSVPCCRDGPLLTYDGTTAQPRCEQPDFSVADQSFTWVRSHSPAPQPLRALAPVSSIAASLVSSWRLDLNMKIPMQTKWEHYRMALRALRDSMAAKHARLLLVLLPSILGLNHEGGEDQSTFVDSIGQTCKELGIRTIDLTELITPLLKEQPESYWFQSDRIHFTPAAHERVAQWLLPRLTAELQR